MGFSILVPTLVLNELNLLFLVVEHSSRAAINNANAKRVYTNDKIKHFKRIDC